MGAMSVEAATSAAVFHACLDEALLPELRRNRPDAVLIMDNLSAHKAPRIRALLDASGFSYRFLPPYSPDLNPIEPAWATVKARLRRVAAHTADALTRHSARRWPASPLRTRRGSSATAATAVPSDLQNAVAASLLRRAMIEDTLNGAKSTRYKHATRHLLECASLAPGVQDFGEVETHESFVGRLRAKHGRKAGFWGQITEAPRGDRR